MGVIELWRSVIGWPVVAEGAACWLRLKGATCRSASSSRFKAESGRMSTEAGAAMGAGEAPTEVCLHC